MFRKTTCGSNTLCLKERANFILKIDFDDIYQKYSKNSRV